MMWHKAMIFGDTALAARVLEALDAREILRKDAE